MSTRESNMRLSVHQFFCDFIPATAVHVWIEIYKWEPAWC